MTMCLKPDAAILVGPDAGQVFVEPDHEVADQHHVVAGVHRRVGRVAVPQLPDRGRALR